MATNKNAHIEQMAVPRLTRITKERLLELCKKEKLYHIPELNDVLYLHCQGFDSIECLEEYINLKSLWLQSNAISVIEGLKKQTKLRCLFLQNNLIERIENLQYCAELHILNLSANRISKVENCGSDILPCLNTLNLASNDICDHTGLRELENCKTLSVLDLSNNRIDDILVVKVLEKMPQLRVLALQGNPVVSKIPQYRKTLILACKELTFLDTRPVEPKDRACAEAWKRGGFTEERKEHDRWNREERRKRRARVNNTIRRRNKFRRPDNQLAFITSSDSENEIEAEKQRWKHLFDKQITDMNNNIRISVPDIRDANKNDAIHDLKGNLEVNKLMNHNKLYVTEIAGLAEKVHGNHREIEQILENKTLNEEITNNEAPNSIIEAKNELTSSSGKKDFDENAPCKLTLNESSDADTPKKRVCLQIETAKITEDGKFQTNVGVKHEEQLRECPTSKVTTTPNVETEFTTPKISLQLEYEKKYQEVEEGVEELASRMDVFINKLKSWDQNAVEEACGHLNNQDDRFEEQQTVAEDLARDPKKLEIGNASLETSTMEFQIENFLLEEQNKAEECTYSPENYASKSLSSEILIKPEESSTETCKAETFELKMLLQKVRKENEQLYTINSSYKELLKENIAEGFTDASDETSQALYEDIHQEVVDDLREKPKPEELEALYDVLLDEEVDFLRETSKPEELQALHEDFLQEVVDDLREKPKPEEPEALFEIRLEEVVGDLSIDQPKLQNYQFDFETDEENTFREEAKLEEPPVKSIRQVINSFNDFLEEIATKKRLCLGHECKKAEIEGEEKKEVVRVMMSSGASGERKEVAKIMVSSGASVEREEVVKVMVSSGASVSIPTQMNKIEQRRSKELKGILECIDVELERREMLEQNVEEKKQKEDALDGQLLGVEKNITKATVRLPEQQVKNNDGDHSDSAKSDEEVEENIWGKRHWNIKKPYKPSIRMPTQKSIEGGWERHRLEQQAEDDNNDCDITHFLESAYTECRLFKDIDEEFLNSIDLDNLQFDDENIESQHVECTRSYEELREHMRVSKEILYLTKEEKDLLEKMIEQKETQDNNDEQGAKEYDVLKTKENILLQKLLERTKEKEQEDIKKPLRNKAKEIEMKVQRATERLIMGMAKIYDFSVVSNVEFLKDEEPKEVCEQKAEFKENLSENLDEDAENTKNNAVKDMIEKQEKPNSRKFQSEELENSAQSKFKGLSSGMINLFEYGLMNNVEEVQSNEKAKSVQQTQPAKSVVERLEKCKIPEMLDYNDAMGIEGMDRDTLLEDNANSKNFFMDSNFFFNVTYEHTDDIEKKHHNDEEIYKNAMETIIEDDNDGTKVHAEEFSPENISQCSVGVVSAEVSNKA